MSFLTDLATHIKNWANGRFSLSSHNHNLANLSEKSYNSLTDKPSLFSGNYTDLTNKPQVVTDLNNITPASGDVIYYNGTNWVKLPKGTDGQALTLASGLPSWADAGGGGFWDTEIITTVDYSTTGTLTIYNIDITGGQDVDFEMMLYLDDSMNSPRINFYSTTPNVLTSATMLHFTKGNLIKSDGTTTAMNNFDLFGVSDNEKGVAIIKGTANQSFGSPSILQIRLKALGTAYVRKGSTIKTRVRT